MLALHRNLLLAETAATQMAFFQSFTRTILGWGTTFESSDRLGPHHTLIIINTAVPQTVEAAVF